MVLVENKGSILPETDPLAGKIVGFLLPPTQFAGHPRYPDQVAAAVDLASRLTALKETPYPDEQEQNELFMALAIHLTALDPEEPFSLDRLDQLGSTVAKFAQTFFNLESFTRKPGKTTAEIEQAFLDLAEGDCSKARVVNLILEQIKGVQLRTTRASA
jgi:hypothetical protein